MVRNMQITCNHLAFLEWRESQGYTHGAILRLKSIESLLVPNIAEDISGISVIYCSFVLSDASRCSHRDRYDVYIFL